MKINVVQCHCGSAHVKGFARNFPYYVASLFKVRKNKKGKLIFSNCGRHTYPRRSYRLCEMDAKELAQENNAIFVDGYGSLHNQPFDVE